MASAMDNESTRRKPSIPKERWNKFKPESIELYWDRDLTLQVVANHMRTQHGFDAEQHMYKKRLDEWGIRKNYTAKQKLQLHACIQQQDGETDDILVNGKPLGSSVRFNGMVAD
ncbi:uncharacterized protein A1O5_07122 [Cladophialophora psammophila CBS 110553]|uniref:Clr5 domain-containing protein n=1 Tax=Cladophialophora psammophila CBS 110553 TaxID=1182543 RepID=W9XI61_9EURO|nr:uncharacterized protein A1O5_07122 [Cladophialophora psammophila CBS 110553]EXJ70049.1 hypothetical protein A1O5_07122 [Cladophialophora psammophila CBS 110553]